MSIVVDRFHRINNFSYVVSHLAWSYACSYPKVDISTNFVVTKIRFLLQGPLERKKQGPKRRRRTYKNSFSRDVCTFLDMDVRAYILLDSIFFFIPFLLQLYYW